MAGSRQNKNIGHTMAGSREYKNIGHTMAFYQDNYSAATTAAVSECFLLICLLRLLLSLNAFSQLSHLKGLSPAWILMCSFRLVPLGKRRSHSWQAYFFCSSKLKLLPQIVICILRLLLSLNAFSQLSHWKGLSPVWILMCSFRVDFQRKRFPQYGQLSWNVEKNIIHSNEQQNNTQAKGS